MQFSLVAYLHHMACLQTPIVIIRACLYHFSGNQVSLPDFALVLAFMHLISPCLPLPDAYEKLYPQYEVTVG